MLNCFGSKTFYFDSATVNIKLPLFISVFVIRHVDVSL